MGRLTQFNSRHSFKEASKHKNERTEQPASLFETNRQAKYVKCSIALKYCKPCLKTIHSVSFNSTIFFLLSLN